MRHEKVVRAYVAAALAYATVELWFLELLRLVVRPDVFVATPRLFSLASVITCGVAGGLAGAAHGLLTRREDLPLREIAAGFVVAAFGVNAALHVHWSIVPVCALALVLLAAIAAALRSARVRNRIRWITSAWTASLLLLAPDWVANDRFNHASHTARGVAFGLTALLVLVVAAAGGALWQRVRVESFRRYLPSSTIVATVAAALVLAPLPAETDARASPPSNRSSANVLFVTLDTVRADHLSLQGYALDTTPYLRALARTATLYERAIAPSNMTLSSHASFFTGLYASEHGAHAYAKPPLLRPLRAGVPTLAEIFSRRGYEVSGVAANYIFLGTDFGLTRGFQDYDCRPAATTLAAIGRSSIYDHVMPPRFTAIKKHVLRYPIWQALVPRLGLWPVTPDIMRADEVTRRATRRIEHATSTGRPFFLFVNYFDAHAPYLPPPPFDTQFRRTAESQPADERRKGFAVSEYDGTIAFIDSQLRILIDRLRELQAYDNTLIVITSDHGEAFGEHGMFFHGSSTFDEQVHIPLIVKLPGQLEGRTIASPVSTVQLFSLIRSMGEEQRWDAPAIAEGFPLDSAASPSLQPGRALVRDQYKLIRSVEAPVQLFDLLNDPGELRNLAPADPQRVSAMTDALNAWIGTHPPRPQPNVPLAPETIQKLRALGYVR